MFPSKRLILSYGLDWIVIVIFAAAGGGLDLVKSKKRPFALVDLDISFPFVQESISVLTVGLVSLVAPAICIAAVILLFVPGPSVQQNLTRSTVIRRKLWEAYAGLTGLALSVAVAFFVTQGLKNIFGKPRPHLLALCKPDVANIGQHIVGPASGRNFNQEWTLVDASICTQTSKLLNDSFRSFPSGHCSFSFSGLLYLSLFCAAKFGIAIPHLPLQFNTPTEQSEQRASTDTELLPLRYPPASSSSAQGKAPERLQGVGQSQSPLPLCNLGAAPPLWGVLLFLVPIGVATYISATRYFEFWHFGFDVISGALIGIISAWFSFRWYQTPLGYGEGWAWGPRSRNRAFAIAVGTDNYVGPEGWDTERRAGQQS